MARLSLRRILGPKLPAPDPLYVCAACREDFVNPDGWRTAEDGTRHVRLRCGACGHARETAITPTAAVLLEAAHEHRRQRLVADLAVLERENMTDWVERFTDALARDLIDAGDFTAS